MSWQEAVEDVAADLEERIRLYDEYEVPVIQGFVKRLRGIIQAAESAAAPVAAHRAVDTLQAERSLKKLAEAEELRSSAQAMRRCEGGSLDETYVPSAGVSLGKPVKSPATGEWYVLKEDGLMHFCKEGPKACP